MEKKGAVITTIIALVVGSAGFYAGTLYQKTKPANNQFQHRDGSGPMGNRSGG